MSQHVEHHPAEADAPVSVSHFVHTIKEYMPAIRLGIAAVMLGYAIIALIIYLTSPSARVTTVNFRLDFQGAAVGNYPNDTKFSPAEIVAAPILLKVYKDNDLASQISFPRFRNSIFILEANKEYETLAADYGARLSDPKLNPVDRERIQREFELKRASLGKNDYSINYRSTAQSKLPDRLVGKVLGDILTAWAERAVREQQVGAYRVAVLSPSMVEAGPIVSAGPVAEIQILRTKILQVMSNIGEISFIPTTALVRTQAERLSLSEIRLRLEEIIRFRIEPLVPIARDAGGNSAELIRFLETQLSFDERRLAMQREEANAVRDALAVYSMSMRAPGAEQTGTGAPRAADKPVDAPETVVPQISESFIDRLVTLTKNSADTEYRQKLVTDLRMAMLRLIPLEEAVSYDQRVLAQVRAGTAGRADVNEVRKEIAAIRNEVKGLVANVNEIYRVASSHLTPSTQLYSSGTPLVRTERTTNLDRLALYGVLVFLLSIPLAILFALLHKRVREEEAADRFVTAVPAAGSEG